jgi:hypothetical protein
MSNLFGGSWRDHVPEGWTLPTFDWSDLGEFGKLQPRLNTAALPLRNEC